MLRTLTLSLALLVSAPALAQSIADEADTHFRQGAAAYDAFNYQDALLHFMQSNRLSPNPTTAGNVGHTYVALKQYPEAYRWYALALSLTDGDDKGFRESMNSIADKVVLIDLSSNPEGATVYLDRKSLGAVATSPAVIAVAPGDYTLIFEAEGHKPFTSETYSLKKLGSQTEVFAELEVILADVDINGEEGATVRVENAAEPLGTIPFTANLAPGPTVLLVEKEGFETEKVLVTPNLEEKIAVDVSLSPVTGQIEFLATQRGARVEVDGELVGYTPVVADLPVGAREVTVLLDGYRPYSTSVDVTVDGQDKIDAPLLPLQTVVTGSGVAEAIEDAPASIVVLTKEQIAERGYDNLSEMLKDLPGFDAMTTNGITYQNNFQRGYRTPWTQRTLFLVDGRVENHLWSHMANLSRQYPITMIERVEVLYGPASAVYGPNAFNGIINVVTKQGTPDAFSADVKAGYGSFDTRVVDGTFTGGAGKIRYSFSGRYFGSDEANLCGEWGHTDCDDWSNPELWGAFADPGNADNPPLQSNGIIFSDGWADPTDNWGVRGSVGIDGFDLSAMAFNRSEGYGAMYPSDKVHPATDWTYTSRQVYARYTKDLNQAVRVSGEAGWRESRVFGEYAENFDGFLSLTSWNSVSNSLNMKLNADYRPNDNLQFVGGINFEHKVLTKAYDIPGYYDAFSSVTLDDRYLDRDGDGVPDVPVDERTETTDGDYVFLPDAELGYFRPAPEPQRRMPAENLQPTDDIGAFAQVIANVSNFRFNAGLRVDHNSFYHRPLFSNGADFQIPDPSDLDSTIAKNAVSVNPRLTAIAKVGDGGALKLLYGEAFQEPAPVLVWGGFSGRGSNENLIPEKARNLEFVAMYRTPRLANEVSAYAAFYNNVITEAAQNAGTRRVLGIEYRGSASLKNPIPDSADITGYLNYTFTAVNSSQDFIDGAFTEVADPVNLGDIAPHKVNFGFNVPVAQYVNVNNRFNFVSSRTPYLSNALRSQGFTFDPYFLWNAHVLAGPKAFKIGAQLNNILGADYLVPGGELAGAGNNFEEQSIGFHNSALPTAGRSVLITANVKL